MERVLTREAYRTYGPLRTGFWTVVHAAICIACVVGAVIVGIGGNPGGVAFLCATALFFAWLVRAYGTATGGFVRAARDLEPHQILARISLRPPERELLGPSWVIVVGDTGMRFTQSAIFRSPPVYPLAKADIEIGDLIKNQEFWLDATIDGKPEKFIAGPRNQVVLLYDYLATLGPAARPWPHSARA